MRTFASRLAPAPTAKLPDFTFYTVLKEQTGNRHLGGIGCHFEKIAHRSIEALVEPITQLSPDFGGAEVSHKAGNGDCARANRIRAPEKALSIVFRTLGSGFSFVVRKVSS
jgi:hypothetical protein